jgi:hypothetical protein
MALVTVEQFAARVKLDLDPNGQDDRLPDVELALTQAQDAVFDYLKTLPDPMWTEETLPARVSASIMLVAQALYDGGDKAGDMLSGLGTGDPRNPVVAMLIRLRDPALA